MVPNAQLFFLTSEALKYIVDMTQVNKALIRRRWFAKDLIEVEDDFKKDEKTRKICQQVSLTTLNYLADDDKDWNKELRKKAREAIAKPNEIISRLSIYQEYLSYESIMLLHRAYTRSQYLGLSSFMESWATEGPFDINNFTRKSGILIANVFSGGDKDKVETIPGIDWLMERSITIKSDNDMIVDQIPSHPLYWKELHRIATVNKDKCQNITHFQVELPNSIFTPKSIYNIPNPINETKMFLFSIPNGIRVSLMCHESSNINYICLPNKFDTGNLTCMVDLPDNTALRPRRSPEVEDDFMITAVDVFRNSARIWEKIMPSVFSCSISYAGCDFCFYFLSTYNISASPAACVGGCSLGAFGGCTRLIGSAIQETYQIF